MSLLTIALPPGIYRNGTDYQAKGRYWNANLVRWFSGELRPMGGWQIHSSSAAAMTGVPRGMLAWTDNSGNRWIVIGTASKLYVMSGAGVLSDITPSGLTVGVTDATVLTGYGYGPYGSGAYGMPSSTIGGPVQPATSWTTQNFGEDLVCCSDADGKIYQWLLNPATAAAVVSGAPTGNAAIVVTPDGFLMALGAGGNPRFIQWCDQRNITSWTPGTTNQAGNFPLQTAGVLLCGASVVNETLIFSTVDVWAAQYVGFPYVYGFKQVGNDCGPLSKHAVATNGATAFWMSAGGFYQYDGTVAPIPSDVQDYVYSNINLAQASKIWAVHLSLFNEVMWLYPSAGSTEIDSYVIYNYEEGHWNIGSLARTCAVDRGAFTMPLMCSSSGLLYEHETGYQYGGAQPFAETGPFELGNGQNVMQGSWLYGDEKAQGDVNLTVYTRLYPNSPESTWGPFSLTTTPTSVRFSGRQARFLFQADSSDDWRIGNMRVDVSPRGQR